MRSSTIYTLATAAVLASAGPINRNYPTVFPRQNSTVDPSVVLAFALETAFKSFYSQVADKFTANDFENAGFSNGDAAVEIILNVEIGHLKEVQKLSPDSLPNCSFDFSNALTNPVTSMVTARLAEVIGSGAYMGALATETNSKSTEVFAQIMAVEEQHYELINAILEGNSTAQSFGLSMTLDEVLLLVTPFAPSCDPPLPTPPNIALNITNPPPYTEASILELDLSNTACANLPNTFCQFLTGNSEVSTSVLISNNSCSVADTQGPALLYVTNSSVPVSGDVTSRENLPFNYCAGPALIIVDPTVPAPLPLLNATSSA